MSAFCSEGDLSPPRREGRAFLGKAVAGNRQVLLECLEVLRGEPGQVCSAGYEHRTLGCWAEGPDHAPTLKGSSKLGT